MPARTRTPSKPRTALARQPVAAVHPAPRYHLSLTPSTVDVQPFLNALTPYTDERGAIVIMDVADEHVCDGLFETGKTALKAIEAHYEGDDTHGKKLLRRVTKLLADMERQELSTIQPKYLLLKSALIAAKELRRQAEERERQKIREQLEHEAREKRDADLKALEEQAKAARGPEKQELKQAAQELRQEPVRVSERVVEALAPSADESMMSATRQLPYQAVVDSFDQLFEAAYRDRELRKYFKVDQVALNIRARADEANLNLPGVRAIRRTTLV